LAGNDARRSEWFLPRREAFAPGGAGEEAVRMIAALVYTNGELSGVAAAEAGAVGVETAEEAEVVHRVEFWQRGKTASERLTDRQRKEQLRCETLSGVCVAVFGAEVERTAAEIASRRIHLGVSVRSRLRI
jgi:hypothetical protein